MKTEETSIQPEVIRKKKSSVKSSSGSFSKAGCVLGCVWTAWEWNWSVKKHINSTLGWSKFGTGGNGGYAKGDSVECGGIGRGLCNIGEESTCYYYR